MDGVKDIVPELLESIQKAYSERLDNSDIIRALNDLLREGKVTYSEANRFSQKVGDVLSGVYSEIINVGILPDGRMYFNIADRLIRPTMRQAYENISEYSADVQSVLNTSAGIKVAGITGDLNQDRISGIVNKISEQDDFSKVAWLLDEPIRNFCQSIVDDTVRKNIEFHHSLVSPKITRKEAGNCCDWCKAIVGTYRYPHEVPEDIYRRHRYCRCEVLYDPADGSKKKQDIWSKKWKQQEENAKIESRKTYNTEPKTLRIDDIPTQSFTKGSGKNYPVRFMGSDHVKFNSDLVKKVTIIAGDGVSKELKVSSLLAVRYNQPTKRWKKISGEASILYKGRDIKSEIHWYEINGRRYEIKVKRVFEDESEIFGKR